MVLELGARIGHFLASTPCGVQFVANSDKKALRRRESIGGRKSGGAPCKIFRCDEQEEAARRPRVEQRLPEHDHGGLVLTDAIGERRKRYLEPAEPTTAPRLPTTKLARHRQRRSFQRSQIDRVRGSAHRRS